MDVTIIVLALLFLLAVSGWGYGHYTSRPRPGPQARPVAARAPARWVHAAGVVSLFLLALLALLLLTGRRPAF